MAFVLFTLLPGAVLPGYAQARPAPLPAHAHAHGQPPAHHKEQPCPTAAAECPTCHAGCSHTACHCHGPSAALVQTLGTSAVRYRVGRIAPFLLQALPAPAPHPPERPPCSS